VELLSGYIVSAAVFLNGAFHDDVHKFGIKFDAPVLLCCAIGDETVDGLPYEEIVAEAAQFITAIGGFEKFAEWGLF